MTPELREELMEALRSNDGQLGKVFALLESGSVTNRELVDGFAAANQSAAANLRVTVKAILEGVFPSGPTVAAQSRRSIGGLIRDNPGLSEAARSYLEDLRIKLEVIATDSAAIELEDRVLDVRSKDLELSLEKMAGVYVFTLPSFYRTVQKTDPERFWFKIGKTERNTGKRIREIMGSTKTGWPEDPKTLRVYSHPVKTPKEIETGFHRLLISAGHYRATGDQTGRDWFATNLEFLDAIAVALGCEIFGTTDLEE